MTAPIQPTTLLPDTLGRVLSPEEFMQARGMTPTALRTAKFPAIPPVARDATHVGPADTNPHAQQLTGLPRILTQYVAEPILDHPVASVVLPAIPGSQYVMAGLMGKDILEYASQKAAELQMTPEQRKTAEADPNRISGERAAVEAVMLGAAPVAKGLLGRMGAAIDRVRGKAPADLLTPVADAAASPATGTSAADGLLTDASSTAPSAEPAATLGNAEAPAAPPRPVPAQAAVQGHVARVTDAWKTMFTPATRSPEAMQAANILRATTGEMAASYEQAAYKLDEFRRAIEPLPESDKLGFIDAIEGGRSQPSPEFQPAADAIRSILDGAREDIQNLGTGKLDHFIENYFPHIWTDPDRAGDAFKLAAENAAKAAELERAAPPSSPAALTGEVADLPSGRQSSMESFVPRNGYARQDVLGMTADEIQNALEEQKTYESSSEESVFGAEGAKRWKALQRRANNTYNHADAREASAEIQRIEESLTPAQQSRLYGIGETGLSADELRPLADDAEFYSPENAHDIPEAHLLATVGREMTTGRPLEDTGSAIRLRGAMAELERRGQKPDDVFRAALNGRVQNGFGSASDIVELAKETWHDLTEAQANRPKAALPSGATASPESANTAEALNAARARMGGKRPMEGSKSFLKQRTIPTTLEGMEMGLTPVSTNPVDLTLLKLREMQRYLMAHQSLSEMKDAGLVKLVRAGDIAPDGYSRIDDNVATVFGPRQGVVTLPEDANVAPEDVGVLGRRIMGQYWAPEPVARVVNNYLSPGLRGNALYDAYRGAGNTLNQAQLGLSAFHLMFTSMDASVSRAALGLEYIASGKPVEGLREIASAPVAPVTNMQLGAKIRSAYLNPEGASPDMLALANAVKEAGGRVRMDSFYQNSAPERMIAAWRAGEYGKATALSLPALFEAAAKPIMEHIVPLQKLGVFGDLAKKALADLPPEATLPDRRAALASAWDSVDNRMGQLVYDNLFWNKTFKDLAMASVRSVGWNIGTIRELGGGIGDVAGMAADAAQGNEVALTHRAAYVMALPVTVGLYGALYQYLRTGESPSELKDYFYPKTGDVDPDGNPERVQIASYMKDFFAYHSHPWETVKHKMNPILSTVYEMLQNQDYYGDEIRNPHDPLVKQVGQEAKYMGEQVMPFSWRNMMESTARGDVSTGTKIGNWFGITPAPRTEVRTDAQNLMAEYLSERQMSGATPEDADARQTRAEILSALRGHSDIDLNDAITNAIERHQLTPPQLAQLLKRAGTTPAQERFKRLTAAQAIEVFKRSTPREKALFAEALIAKIERMTATNDVPIPTEDDVGDGS